MENKNRAVDTIVSVINELKNLFKDKGELRGFDDWDHMIGCIMALQNVCNQLSAQQAEKE